MKIKLKMFIGDSRKPHFVIKLPPKGGQCAYCMFYGSPSSWAIWGDWHPFPKKKQVGCDSPWFKWTL